MTTDSVDYSTLMPNNVGPADDQKLLRALERWYPKYLEWWVDMGPSGFIHETPFQEADVWLRTAVSVEQDGWAKFDFVKMPQYRWGILLAPQEEARTIPFGEHKGEPAWQEVPGAYRAMLRRLIVIQGDTEPASVEQQRFLGRTAPSFYDMRNLFQVNVEEGRHLWAMVYLLHRHFGRDGREEAEDGGTMECDEGGRCGEGGVPAAERVGRTELRGGPGMLFRTRAGWPPVMRAGSARA